ncbi:hypothetical protein MRX96_052224 [Rhipicephalus microplus]
MPASRVCSICGRLPSATIVLPCGDVFCELCLDEVCDEAKYPFDGRAFTKRQLVRLRFELSELEQRRVVCVLAGRQCAAFDGQLSELRDRMRRCRSMDVKCAKCNRLVTRETALEHYNQCSDGNAKRVSHSAVLRPVEEVRGVKRGLGRMLGQAFGERDSEGAKLPLRGGEGNEEVGVRFGMHLKSGDWDDFVAWPFSKSYYNHGLKTEKKRWENIEIGGYVVRNTLYVNVELE